MLPWLLVAMVLCLNGIICINFFNFGQGSPMSFAIWQIICMVAYLAIYFFRKRLAAVKPD